MNLQDNDQFC